MSKIRRVRGRGRQPRAAAKGVRKTDDGLALQKIAEDMEFELMDSVYAFSVDVLETDTNDSTGLRYRNVVFKTGDDVILNSNFDNTDDIWLGQISQIRTTRDKTKTLVKVRWYWSRNDVAGLIKSFNWTKCSPYERILSDDYDYVSPYAFQGTSKCASNLADKFQDLTPHFRPSEPPDTMHFCPSLNCRKWYHSNCLAVMQHIDTTSHPSTRRIRLLANDPDSEAPFVMFGHFSEPESREIVPDSTEQMSIYDALELWTRKRSILAHLPPSLLAIAQSPIVRSAGAPGGWAIGNVADVVLARRFVYAAVEHGGPPQHSAKFFELLKRERARQEDIFWLAQRRSGDGTVDSTEMMDVDMDVGIGIASDHGKRRVSTSRQCQWGGLWDGLKEDSDCSDGGRTLSLTGKEKEPDEVSALEGLCEDLGQFELLASVYVPYWERRWQKFEEAAVLLDSPDFVCPQCRSAI
ncbi:hypothetical protein LXA43DRAFT_918496 [Ganoderma leucocontextum]|nr:hypothetical protein LXA43DRAFT_918496 [Ganoderma leucocontextum]